MRGNSLVPSTIVKTLICIDDIVDYDLAGRIYNIYMPEPVRFTTMFYCISVMDKFFDNIAFPQAYCDVRTFHQQPKKKYQQHKSEVQQYMSEEILLNEQGKKATFMIQVQFRQNATWQGTITWMDEKKTQHFRSTLEMIKLMDGAIIEAAQQEGLESGITGGTWE